MAQDNGIPDTEATAKRGGIKRLLIAEEWDKYSRMAIHSGAGTIQRREMRRAFYAGASGILFGIIRKLANDRGNCEPTEEDILVMAGVQHELDDFITDIERGRA